jgi:hypothetical protein
MSCQPFDPGALISKEKKYNAVARRRFAWRVQNPDSHSHTKEMCNNFPSP